MRATLHPKIKIYENVILPLVLYEYETWSVTLREEHRPRVFENRVLRGIFVPKRGEVIGGWRKVHSEELHSLYSSLNITRMMRWAGNVAWMGEKRNPYRVSVGKQEGRTYT
jgi:hypothetical protein